MNGHRADVRRLRFVLLGAAVACAAVGLWSGLALLAIRLPGGMPDAAAFHGAMMICGLFGTLISLERAVAIGRWWAYAAPVLAAGGAVLLLAGIAWLAAWVFLLASLTLIGNSSVIVYRQPALFTAVLAIAAACWGEGIFAWAMGSQATDIAAWWLAFLVLTIAAERLELSRLLAPPRSSQAIFALSAALLLIGVARREFSGGTAFFSGIGLIAMTLWLLRHDVALRTLRHAGQPRFAAICLICGYVWLGVAGLALLFVPPGRATFSYDATIHAVTIGFVLSMVFGHTPIILPAVTGFRVRVTAAAYFPLGLLHLSLLLRIVADFCDWVDLRALSGPLTVAALAAYAGVLIAGRPARHEPDAVAPQ